MRTTRTSVAALACLIIAARPWAADRAPDIPERPVDAIVTAASPKRLAKLIDAVIEAAKKDIGERTDIPSGFATNAISMFSIPSLSDNPGIALALLADFHDGRDMAFAIAVDGAEPKALAGDLKNAGYNPATQGRMLVADLGAFSPGLKAYLTPLGGSRILVGPTPAINERFAEAAANWVPDRSGTSDAALRINLRRLREAFPAETANFRKMLRPDIGGGLEDRLPSRLDEAFRKNLAATILELTDRLIAIPLETEAAEAALALDGDALRLSLAVVPQKGGALDRFASGHAGVPAPQFRLARAIARDAVFYSASTRLGGTLLEEGELLSGAAGILAAGALPSLADDILALRKSFAALPVEEEVIGYYANNGALRRVNYTRVRDGKAYADLLAGSAEAANKALQGVLDRMPADGRGAARLEEERGRDGDAAYRRLRPRIVDSNNREAAAANAFSLYLASNKNTVLTLLGKDIPPSAVSEAIARLGRNASPGLAQTEAVGPILEQVRSCRVEHGLVRPVSLARLLVALADGDETPESGSALERLPDFDTFCGYGLDAGAGVVEAKLIVPLRAVGEIAAFAVAMEKGE